MKFIRRFTSFLIFMLLIFQATTISAQDEDVFELFTGDTYSLYSETIDQEYFIGVTVPPSYAESDEEYPVLYLLDGGITQRTASDIARLGDVANTLPGIIIVGIDYPESEVGARRMRDYVREAGVFLEFMESDIIPLIEENYRVDSSDRAIAGWSAGGYFALYTLFNSSNIFSRYLSISPPIFDGIGEIEQDFAQNPTPLFARVNIIGSTLERIDMWESFGSTLQSRNYVGLQQTTYFVDNANHFTILPTALALGMTNLYCFSQQGCSTVEVIVYYEFIEDANFPAGFTFTTPDAFIALKIHPSRVSPGAGSCRNQEVTVITVAQVNDAVWVQLECGDSVGWIQRDTLEE